MPTYPISNVTRRVVYTGSAGTGPYAFSFEVLVNTDIAVYKNSTLLTLTTDYTVTINANGTGSVTLNVAASGSDSITIVGNRAVQRTSDFVTGGDLFANTLNDELDSQTIFVQQVSESVDRSIKAPITDPTSINMTLPSQSTRANKVMSFDATGNPESIVLKGDIASAASYASTAQSAATSASSTLSQFRGIYYGPASSDPAVDPNGAAPTQGDLYFNTATLIMRTYTGSAWADVGTATPATFATQTFSGTGSQTAFTLSSAPSSLAATEVYISGVAQVPTTAYSVSGTTLTFVSAPASGTDNILVRWVGGVAVGVPNDGSVTTAKIQDGAVTTVKLADTSVTTAKLADSNVTTAKIADLNVTTAKLADSSVTSAKIADATIVAGDLANGAATLAKLDRTGSSGQVLTAQGSGNAPVWATPASITLLGTMTTTSGTAQTLSSLDLSQYKFLKVFVSRVSHDSGTSRSLRFNSISGPQFSATASASSFAYGTVDIDLSANGAYGASVHWTATSGVSGDTTGSYAGETGITTLSTSITVAISGGNFDGGSIYVYGVK
jgi:hypothetical protein